MTLNGFSIEFLVRSRCPLCDEAAPGVRRAARLAGATVQEIDIDADDVLVRDFGMRIPVVRAAGAVVAEGHIDPVRLWWRLVNARFAR